MESPGSKFSNRPPASPLGSVWRLFISARAGIAWLVAVFSQYLNYLAQDLGYGWGFAFFGGLIFTALLVAVLQPLALWGVHQGGIVLQLVALLPCLIATIIMLALTIWAFWNRRSNPTNERAYVVALSTSSAAICLSILSFADLTLVLASHRALQVHNEGLFALERFFAWQFAGTVPLIDIPGTLNWHEPQLSGHADGAVSLAFKIVVITPVISVVIATFGFIIGETYRLRQKQEKRRQEQWAQQRKSHGILPIPDLVSWIRRYNRRIFLLQCAACITVGAAVIDLLDARSVLHAWLNTSLPVSISVLHRHIMTNHQILLTIECIAVALFTVMLIAVVSSGRRQFRADSDQIDIFDQATVYSFLMLGSILLIAGINLLLLNFSAARIASSNSMEASAGNIGNYFAWHIADMVPVFKLTSTLQWHTSLKFGDAWSGWLLLIAKTICVLVAVIPVARLLRVSQENFRQKHRPVSGQIAVLRDFDREVGNIISATGQLINAKGKKEANKIERECDDLLYRLKSITAKVSELFGEGPISDSAEEWFDAMKSYAALLPWIDQVSRDKMEHALATYRQLSASVLKELSASIGDG